MVGPAARRRGSSVRERLLTVQPLWDLVREATIEQLQHFTPDLEAAEMGVHLQIAFADEAALEFLD